MPREAPTVAVIDMGKDAHNVYSNIKSVHYLPPGQEFRPENQGVFNGRSARDRWKNRPSKTDFAHGTANGDKTKTTPNTNAPESNSDEKVWKKQYRLLGLKGDGARLAEVAYDPQRPTKQAKLRELVTEIVQNSYQNVPDQNKRVEEILAGHSLTELEQEAMEIRASSLWPITGTTDNNPSTFHCIVKDYWRISRIEAAQNSTHQADKTNADVLGSKEDLLSSQYGISLQEATKSFFEGWDSVPHPPEPTKRKR